MESPVVDLATAGVSPVDGGDIEDPIEDDETARGPRAMAAVVDQAAGGANQRGDEPQNNAPLRVDSDDDFEAAVAPQAEARPADFAKFAISQEPWRRRGVRQDDDDEFADEAPTRRNAAPKRAALAAALTEPAGRPSRAAKVARWDTLALDYEFGDLSDSDDDVPARRRGKQATEAAAGSRRSGRSAALKPVSYAEPARTGEDGIVLSDEDFSAGGEASTDSEGPSPSRAAAGAYNDADMLEDDVDELDVGGRSRSKKKSKATARKGRKARTLESDEDAAFLDDGDEDQMVEDAVEEEEVWDQPEKIMASKTEDGAVLYQVKFKGKSYRKTQWLSKATLTRLRPQLIAAFIRKRSNPANGDIGVRPEWTCAERIFAERSRGGRKQYYVKWCTLGYSESTWEDESDLLDGEKELIERFHRFDRMPAPSRPTDNSIVFDLLANGKGLPTFKNGRTLRSYQKESFEWMVAHLLKRENAILGDEMGLGKTAQSISVLEFRRTVCNVRGPFLVVAPLTTLGHWRREIETWTDMNVVAFMGSAPDRQVIADHELYFRSSGGGFANRRMRVNKFDVLLTSFEMLRDCSSVFNAFEWDVVIVDEAHRLKSLKSSTRASVQELRTSFLLLLTGTPIQNNMSELFSIMNLVDPEKFDDPDDFLTRFGNPPSVPSTPEQMLDLQEVLRPVLLRRMKEDVETLPDKEEVIIWVELTNEQRSYYKAMYENQISALLGGGKQANLPNMRNLAMELRKVCCHPFLSNGLEEDLKRRMTQRDGQRPPGEQELLEAGSGKLKLMSKLIPKLRAEGHKLLIFSQFKIMLDLLEDYLNLLAVPYERIDGDTAGQERQVAMDRFQAGGDGTFAFLLSTKAGGQGITLTAADTIIIYDSDWNPQNDVQAMARAHRIGQTSQVTIYRLVTKGTYEEQLLNTANQKYGLNEAILGNINAIGNPEDNAKRIAELLKHGAYSIMGDQDAAAANTEEFEKAGIDDILSRRTTKRNIANKAGNSFSVATFNSNTTKQGNDKDFWTGLLPDAVKAHEDAKRRHNLMDGPRRRARVNYQERSRAADLVGSDDEEFVLDDGEVDLAEDHKIEVPEGIVRKGRKAKSSPDAISLSDLTRLDDVLNKWGYARVIKRLELIQANSNDTTLPGEEGAALDEIFVKEVAALLAKTKWSAAGTAAHAAVWKDALQAAVKRAATDPFPHEPEYDKYLAIHRAASGETGQDPQARGADGAAPGPSSSAVPGATPPPYDAAARKQAKSEAQKALTAWIRAVLSGYHILTDVWSCGAWDGAKNHLLFRSFRNAESKLEAWGRHDDFLAAMSEHLEKGTTPHHQIPAGRTTFGWLFSLGFWQPWAKCDWALLKALLRHGFDHITQKRATDACTRILEEAFSAHIANAKDGVAAVAERHGQLHNVIQETARSTGPATSAYRDPKGVWHCGGQVFTAVARDVSKRARALISALCPGTHHASGVDQDPIVDGPSAAPRPSTQISGVNGHLNGVAPAREPDRLAGASAPSNAGTSTASGSGAATADGGARTPLVQLPLRGNGGPSKSGLRTIDAFFNKAPPRAPASTSSGGGASAQAGVPSQPGSADVIELD